MTAVPLAVATVLLYLIRRVRPMTVALALYKSWQRLPPQHRQRLLDAARRNGPRVASYPELREIVWAQEEPQNMGAWRSLRHRLEEAAAHAPSVDRVHYVGRSWRASPSEGYPTLHHYEQDRIVREALGFRIE